MCFFWPQVSLYAQIGQGNIENSHSQPLAAFSDYGEIDPELLSLFGTDWKEIMTMKCEIPEGQANQDAGLAIFAGSNIFVTRDSREPLAVSDRRIFTLVDNDLRGFRLDGKSYAQDYARYGNGRGVRVKFSKGIATQLTSQHFVVRFTDDTENPPAVTQVVHTPNSPYANVLIGRPVANAVMRLVSTGTTVVEDIDGGLLADGSFVAALEYDANAPRATTITKVSFVDGRATWNIGFSAPLYTHTVRAENLCITNEDDICTQQGQATTPSIVSASLNSSTTMSVIVDEVGSNMEDTYSLEF